MGKKRNELYKVSDNSVLGTKVIDNLLLLLHLILITLQGQYSDIYMYMCVCIYEYIGTQIQKKLYNLLQDRQLLNGIAFLFSGFKTPPLFAVVLYKVIILCILYYSEQICQNNIQDVYQSGFGASRYNSKCFKQGGI